jgi:hypothetical protein
MKKACANEFQVLPEGRAFCESGGVIQYPAVHEQRKGPMLWPKILKTKT